MILELLQGLWAILTASPGDLPVIESAAYGTSILIALGTSLLSTAVSMGVSALLAPNVKGPRQKDQGVQTSDYGAPIPLWYGPENRHTGQVIFYSGLHERKRKRSGSGGSTTTFTYFCSAAIAWGAGKPGAKMGRVWANKKLIYHDQALVDSGRVRNGRPLPIAWEFTFYDGSDDQMPDPNWESYKGIGNVPAYRHTMYSFIHRLALAEFGPSLPQFEAHIVAEERTDAAEVITDFANRAGVDIDVSMLDGNIPLLDGYVVSQDMNVSEAIAPLALAFYFDLAERGGELVCVPRGMDPVATIPRSDMGAVAFKSGVSEPGQTEHTRKGEAQLPAQVAVSFIDLFRDLQINTQRADRNLGNAKENISISLPITLDSNQAHRIAARVLWGTIVGRRTAKATVSARWRDILPGMVVNLEVLEDVYLPFRLERATEGADGVIEWELGYEDAEIYDCAVSDGQSVDLPETGDEGDGGAVGPATWIPMDIPILRNSQDDPGFFWGAIGTASEYAGAQLHRSTDGGTDYEPVGPFLGPLTTGTVATATPSASTFVWDRQTVIRVSMQGEGELESRSEVSVLNGQNAAYLGPTSGHGGEIIQFATATLVGANEDGSLIYDLSDLLRGRRGTEWAVGNHGANERFVLLSESDQIARQDFSAADLGLERLYKAVAAGEVVDDVTAVAFTNTGEGLKPFSPARLIGRSNEDGDVTITWHRRTRLVTGGFGTPAVPLGEEEPQAYQLEIYTDAGRTTLARTLLITNATIFVYTTANQAEDGVTPGDPLWLTCRQRSAVVGYGHEAYAEAA